MRAESVLALCIMGALSAAPGGIGNPLGIRVVWSAPPCPRHARLRHAAPRRRRDLILIATWPASQPSPLTSLNKFPQQRRAGL